MSPPDGTRLECRRAEDFERELLTRARTWIHSWSLDDGGADFGLALLKIASRFNSEVAQRLDKAGVKMARGFLDWLGIPALAARPARLPVVLKMAETAREPVMAFRPVKMQVEVGDSTVTFETESDLQVIPGQLAAVVGVDPAKDSYFLPPPGLTSLAQLEPLPTAWTLKNFVAPGSKSLQLDPGSGLAENMLIEIAGAQYRIVSAKDDLVTIEPEAPAGDGLAAGMRVAKVETFHPFDGARNLQQHILYIGDSDVLNVEAEAWIEVIAPAALREGATWEYWGKAKSDDDAEAEADWLALPLTDLAPERLVFAKPEGPIEEKGIEGSAARWIRARRDRSEQLIGTDSIELKINPSDLPSKKPEDRPPVDLFVNATAAPARDVFLFGQEPRQFDTLYVGCAEAFSKTDAKATIDFELSDGAFGAMSAFNGGRLGPLLAGVDKGGSLHIFNVAADGRLTRLSNREPLRPEPRDATDSGASNYTLTSSDLRPPMWLVGDTLYVAVAAKGEVWVRIEAPSFQIPFLPFTQPAQGKWEFWGAPSGNPEDLITGMAVINVAGTSTLVAMTAAGDLKRKATAAAAWQDQPLALPLNHKLIEIAGVRTANPLKAADNFLAVSVPPAAAGPFTLRLSSSAATAMISNIDPSTLIPFGFEGAGGTTTAVVAKLGPRRLVAQRGAGAPEKVELGDIELSRTDLQKVMFDGNDDGGEFTVYGTGDLGGTPVLLAWRPFDPASEDLLIPTSVEILTGEPKGPVAVVGGRVFLPGDRKGELLTATVAAPDQLSADGADFLSALAVRTSVQLPAGFDRLFVKGDPDPVEVTLTGSPTAGVGSYADTTFYWLNERVDRDTSEDDTFFFSPGTGLQGTVVSHTVAGTVDESEFDIPAPNPVPQEGTVLLIDQGTQGASEDIVTVTAIAGRRITVEPSLSANDGETVDYRVPDAVTGRVFPSLTLDNSNNTLDVARALVSGVHFPDLDPHRQPVIAVAQSGTPATPEQLAFELEWTAPGPGAGNVDFYVSTASAWTQARATVAATAVLAWEYWDGSSWSVLELTKDDTSHLRQSGMVEFTVPRDLQPVDWAGKTNHWVRARIIAGNYGEAKVEVISQQSGKTTTQTVKRTTDDLQPPYAINVSVTYAVDKSIVPTYLRTEDSGTKRDQSDANRTPGAQVEIFMPLADALRRFDAPPAQASSDPTCVADCACDTGAPSMSPAPAQATPAATATTSGSGAGNRAIYLGFTSKLIGQPVNVLFSVASESDYDSIGPLRVDALIKDRFAAIVAEDETRAIGETGLVKMSFDDAPLEAGLFGQDLSWLRLTPRVASDDWAPAIAGVYANGVWAEAAETMTRELLGSSDGRPNLTVALARPPLLQGSLELRINEPLGEEDIQALANSDPAAVKSNVTDLPGNWILWRQVPDPADWGPKDRVFALDEATGTVRLGDGRHGMIPPAGTDSIVAFSYKHTEPAVDGQLAANKVAARTELNLVTPVETVESVAAADRSAGGAGPESAERVMQFAPATLRHRRRAISLRDLEDLVRQKSEEVVQARAFRRGSGVRLVVVTRSADSGPSRAQQRELRRMLLDVAPVALSVPGALTIAGPRVRKLRIALDLSVADLDVGGRVARDSKSRLTARFAPDGGWALGRTPREDDVAEALLDIAGLDGIVSIAFFELDTVGQVGPWQRSVAREELVTLAPEDVRIGFAILEAAA